MIYIHTYTWINTYFQRKDTIMSTRNYKYSKMHISINGIRVYNFSEILTRQLNITMPLEPDV